jgi:hypothetical protein
VQALIVHAHPEPAWRPSRIAEPFVAYAAPRAEATRRNQYLRKEQFLLATAGDREWQARLHAVAGTAAQNRWRVEKSAWAAQR